jgi:hypothetical protein
VGRLFIAVVTAVFYFVVGMITLGKITENYLHSPECRGCREDR